MIDSKSETDAMIEALRSGRDLAMFERSMIANEIERLRNELGSRDTEDWNQEVERNLRT